MAGPDFAGVVWFKSSRSNANGGCVEVAFAPASWRKSSRSNGDCVEVAAAVGAVGVRDSKDPAGPVLAVSPAAWSSFLAEVRRGAFGPLPSG